MRPECHTVVSALDSARRRQSPEGPYPAPQVENREIAARRADVNQKVRD